MLCNLYLTSFALTEVSNLTLSSLLCFTNCVVVITEYLNSNHFKTNESVDDSGIQCLPDKIFLSKKCAAGTTCERKCAAGKICSTES